MSRFILNYVEETLELTKALKRLIGWIKGIPAYFL